MGLSRTCGYCRCAIRFVQRVVRQPSYFMNGVRYMQWACRDFARRRWPRPDALAPRANPFRKLLVVLRTSDFVQHCSSSRGLEEFGIKDKLDVVKRCGASFVVAAERFRRQFGADALRIVLVEDRLSEIGRAVYLPAGPLKEVGSEPGNRETFQRQVDVASQADDETLVCFLEDDYILDPDMFCEAFELFNATSMAGFTPHFHPGLVNGGTNVRLLSVNGKFYAHVPTTTCTFFISATDVRKNLSRLRRYYGSELGNINEIWRHNVCLAPCCRTLAEHMHKSDLSYVWVKSKLNGENFS